MSDEKFAVKIMSRLSSISRAHLMEMMDKAFCIDHRAGATFAFSTQFDRVGERKSASPPIERGLAID